MNTLKFLYELVDKAQRSGFVNSLKPARPAPASCIPGFRKKSVERNELITMPDVTRAVCGLDCKTCPVYIVTNFPDGELSREAVAVQWSKLYGRAVDPAELVCRGCRSGALFAGCVSCPLRDCAADRAVAHCGDCPDHPCDNLNRMYAFNEEHDTGVGRYR